MKISLNVALQPIFCNQGKVLSHEALSRFSEIGPHELFLRLEKYQNPADLFKLQLLVLKRVACYIKMNPFYKPIWVNMSARSLSDPLYVEHLILNIRSIGINKGELGIEITENYMISEDEKFTKNLFFLNENLRHLDIPIILDDFGCKYSNLYRLLLYPFDYIKLDSTFIRNCLSIQRNKIILKKIIEGLKSNNVKVIAEGIESVEFYEELYDLGCEGFQGFLFQKPAIPEFANLNEIVLELSKTFI